ncbi:hypothetical protein H7J07_20155 [Mycobacterium koreense]|uniref:Uncharacterized protein n=1 Tax=Mycolicibacillus koreensis TaxID=1069220 RepID=A0A7I7SHE8_9MYCO|nr:hypothetical protein [Mycolicibacillus koreensis]MCV7250510.1 hypothetical protein [Mycolicibacillus koreensis]ODR04807.1 hypothetical protein BHQ15_16485 [Mycolicibacillus koreensis]OSC32757.1 hypothetical protein B8W67_14240 [Mycolicibacillus koreensis]BBY56377.1 hypothetical protein MKOR_36280 [Mycolicibacillus koreensis]
MRFASGLTAAAVAFAGAAGLPAAVADPPPPPPMPTITGVYDYHEPDAPLEMWVIYSTCVPLGCTLHISTTVPHTSIEKAGEFRLTSGQWAATIPVPDGVKCDDGSHDYTMETYTFDSNTLAGTHTTTHAPVCGLPAAKVSKPFTLTYVEPTPIPNNEHPLWCDDPWWCPF